MTSASAQKTDAAARSAEIAELSRAGKYSEAIPLAQRLLADMEKAHGPDHRDVAAALNNLALLYGNQGRDAEAEPLLPAVDRRWWRRRYGTGCVGSGAPTE